MYEHLYYITYLAIIVQSVESIRIVKHVLQIVSFVGNITLDYLPASVYFLTI